MKLTDFDEICRREYEFSQSDVVSITLTAGDIEELKKETGTIGRDLTGLRNPVTHTMVEVHKLPEPRAFYEARRMVFL